MQRLYGTTNQVDLVSLWRSNLAKGEEYQELLSKLTCWKDRVFVRMSDPDRNYHCFYMLCAAPPERWRVEGQQCVFDRGGLICRNTHAIILPRLTHEQVQRHIGFKIRSVLA